MYPGFHGYATIVYTGSFYYIQMVQDGDTYWLCNSDGGRYRTRAEYKSGDTPTTVPSTTPPSIDNHESTESDNTYISDPTSPSNSTTELNAINRLVQFTFSQIKAIHGLWRTNIKMYNIQIKLRSLMWNMIDGINNITKGIYKQVDLFDAYLPRLDDIYNRLSNIGAASWSSVDVQGRILSNVSGIAFRLDALVTNTDGINARLDSVISNGVVQVGSASLEARLDKLISMYSKVNSVVLDTASVNGGQIKDAVGGELQDVVFWGDTAKSNDEFLTPDGLRYRLGPKVDNTTRYTIDDSIVLRSVNLGSTIPSYIANDPVLYAGVWRKGTDYIISDTYNASTGEYVQRVETITFNRETVLRISQFERANGRYLYAIALASDPTCPNRTFLGVDSPINCTHADAAYYGVPGLYWGGDSSVSVDLGIVVGNDTCILWSSDVATVSGFESWLYSVSPAVVINYVPVNYAYWAAPDDPVWSPTVQYFDPSTIAIPEGDSAIAADYLRITGKYETFDSYIQTADIITAINNLQLSSGVGADLTAITTRLDTLINKTSDTVVNVVNNNTYITNVLQLDDDTSVVDTTKDGVGKVSGLFKWLWNNTFKSAFTHADITKLDGLL
mgnify:CR=1 FL=1